MQRVIDTLQDIYNYRKISERIVLAGQPNEQQLGSVAQAGFRVVINLGLHHSPLALPDEKRFVEALGMRYIHIPVAWGKPLEKDFDAFARAMIIHQKDAIFAHCTEGKRVSTFMALYRIMVDECAREAALTQLRSVWAPNEVWTGFIEEVLERNQGPS